MKTSDVKSGDVVILDGGFSCASAGSVTISEDNEGKYFPCSHGKHYIDGQEDENGELIGISR